MKTRMKNTLKSILLVLTVLILFNSCDKARFDREFVINECEYTTIIYSAPEGEVIKSVRIESDNCGRPFKVMKYAEVLTSEDLDDLQETIVNGQYCLELDIYDYRHDYIAIGLDEGPLKCNDKIVITLTKE